MVFPVYLAVWGKWPLAGALAVAAGKLVKRLRFVVQRGGRRGTGGGLCLRVWFRFRFCLCRLIFFAKRCGHPRRTRTRGFLLMVNMMVNIGWGGAIAAL